CASFYPPDFVNGRMSPIEELWQSVGRGSLENQSHRDPGRLKYQSHRDPGRFGKSNPTWLVESLVSIGLEGTPGLGNQTQSTHRKRRGRPSLTAPDFRRPKDMRSISKP